MPHAYSSNQCLLRSLYLLGNVLGNIYLLSTHQVFTLGSTFLNNSQSIVLFNAAMLVIIYIFDFTITAVRRFRTNYIVGQGLTELHKHEQ